MTPRTILREQSVPPTAGRHVAMPLGGIGTGNVSICADGALRQWQVHNIGNHAGTLPHSFFALRVSCVEPPSDQVRVLQAATAGPADEPTPLVNDDAVPDWQLANLRSFGGVADTRFSATYPFARVRYLDPALPVDITLEAFTPLVPFDVDRSALPAGLFAFTIRNTGPVTVHGTLAAALQNAVGWDGVTPIDGVHGQGYGGNTNRVVRDAGWTSVVMENGQLAPNAAGAGQMVLAADTEHSTALAQWTTPDEFFAYLRSRGNADVPNRGMLGGNASDWRRAAPAGATGASPAGRTWNGGLGVPFQLEPGEEQVVRFVIAWCFPNRYVNFDQFGPPRPEWGHTRFWLGNAYATRFTDAQHVVRTVAREWAELHRQTASWTSTFADSTLDDELVEHMAAQLAYVRSPTCFQSADGRFFGFEGVLGASTAMWNGAFGGSCPLNCTHVWNYEQVVAKVFPRLARDMRASEFEVMQAPEGYLPHRVIAPVYLPQLWGQPIGGPDEPALDGMLGAVLKTYREFRHGAGPDWLAAYWAGVNRLLAYVEGTWDPDGTGVLRGVQPSTHDINLRGVNTYIGTLWLAALRAAEEMAGHLGADAAARRFRSLFERGSRGYDELLFTGDYYVQLLADGEPDDLQWGTGCLSDQLLGQWWAHELDLGHVLPAAHVRAALRSIVRHNFRSSFRDMRHGYRVFADGDDAGLVLCSWPHGGRPAVPLRYADEVWTGVEYQVAAHCLREGLATEARTVLDAVAARYDGSRRNPYNEIECGDHYARAMAGWSVLEAATGYQFDATAMALRLSARDVGAALPFVTDRAWGSLRVDTHAVELQCNGGELQLARLELSDHPAERAGTAAAHGSSPHTGAGLTVTFAERLTLTAGQSLRIALPDPSAPRPVPADGTPNGAVRPVGMSVSIGPAPAHHATGTADVDDL